MTADLHDLLEDAVSDVEPRDRLPAIRTRTRRARRRRATVLGLAGAGVVAATVALVAVVVSPGGTTDDGVPDVATEPGTHVAALYFVGDTPQGPRLFREFRRLPDAPGFASELDALARPDDPDYRSLVNPRTLAHAHVGATEIQVRPSRQLTTIGLQQLAFTLGAAAQEPYAVTLLGPEGAPALTVRADGESLAPIEVSDPAEGARVEDVLVARGRTAAQPSVPWRLEDGAGRAVLTGTAPVTDTDDYLESWETEIDLSGLTPGRYTFVATATADTEDTREGTAPTGATSDTRTIVVE